MKTTRDVTEQAFRYLVLNLAFIPVLLVMRIIEYAYLSHPLFLQSHPLRIEAIGLVHDLRAFITVAFILFIPFLLLSFLHRRTADFFYIGILSLVTLLQFSLIRYFSINLVPLDEVLFRYSFHEAIMILRNSDDLGFLTFFPMLLLMLLISGLQIICRKIRYQGKPGFLLAMIFLAGLYISVTRTPSKEDYDTDTSFYLGVNKSAYFLTKAFGHLVLEKAPAIEASLTEDIDRYQKIHREFDFTSELYPLMHKDLEQDVLGPWFNLKGEPPNLVFIIVESLSQACLGDDSYYGNFTPFLDSLKNHSLSWDNFLSISERTFHVFASIFGSLPYGEGEFQANLTEIPFHYSLIQYLRENGYYTGFYYGGDATFTNYDQFLKKQGIDYIMDDFGPAYEPVRRSYPDFFWGYHDEFTFTRSLELIDSIGRDPRLDIFLTLSTHHPFHPPRADHYLKLYETRTTQPGYPAEKKALTDPSREIFSSVLYTDDALRDLFNRYRRRADFENTIFFITGDHFFMELGYSTISAIERYHVPMIIYSPLLKQPHRFGSVSSHQDLTPSLISLLQQAYPFHKVPYVHWLGKGIDTTATFRNSHTLQFVTSSKALVDYLDGDYLLSNGRLFRIRPGLKTEAVENEQIRERLSSELEVTSNVHRYVAQYNRLLLPELIKMMFFDTTLIHSLDSINYPNQLTTNLYYNLIKSFRFDSTYLLLDVELDFNYLVSETTDRIRLPRLIITIEDSNYKNLIYKQLKFPDGSVQRVEKEQWQHFHIREVLDVRSLDDLTNLRMKLYLFNNHRIPVRCDRINLRIRGVK